MIHRSIVTALFAIVAAFAISCSQPAANAPETKPQNTAQAAPPAQSPQSTVSSQPASGNRAPAKGLTASDIAKMKWLQGSWRGTGADKPFFNRYRLSPTALDIESFDDEAMTKKSDSAHYELKDGMFASPEGKDRFAVSEISDDFVQFVTLTGKTEAFRMERVGDGTVKAILEWTGPDGNPNKKSYILEPLKK